MAGTPTFATGDRIRKRGGSDEGTVERMTGIGARICWDAGPAPRVRPLYCTLGELERISA